MCLLSVYFCRLFVSIQHLLLFSCDLVSFHLDFHNCGYQRRDIIFDIADSNWEPLLPSRLRIFFCFCFYVWFLSSNISTKRFMATLQSYHLLSKIYDSLKTSADRKMRDRNWIIKAGVYVSFEFLSSHWWFVSSNLTYLFCELNVPKSRLLIVLLLLLLLLFSVHFTVFREFGWWVDSFFLV